MICYRIWVNFDQSFDTKRQIHRTTTIRKFVKGKMTNFWIHGYYFKIKQTKKKERITYINSPSFSRLIMHHQPFVQLFKKKKITILIFHQAFERPNTIPFTEIDRRAKDKWHVSCHWTPGISRICSRGDGLVYIRTTSGQLISLDRFTSVLLVPNDRFYRSKPHEGEGNERNSRYIFATVNRYTRARTHALSPHCNFEETRFLVDR